MADFQFSKTEQIKINNAVDEASASLIRQKTVETQEKDFRKDVIERITKDEDVPIDKKLFNALVKERFEGKSSDELEKHEDVIALDEILRAVGDSEEE